MGFGQGLYALDAADGSTEEASSVTISFFWLWSSEAELGYSFKGRQCIGASFVAVSDYTIVRAVHLLTTTSLDLLIMESSPEGNV